MGKRNHCLLRVLRIYLTLYDRCRETTHGHSGERGRGMNLESDINIYILLSKTDSQWEVDV